MSNKIKGDTFLTVVGILICVFALVSLMTSAGCSDVRGFSYAGDGVMSSSQARQAAAVAQAEANALNSIAEEQDRSARSMLSAVDTAASNLGAPEIVSALIGAAGTLFIPPPGSRRKQEKAMKAAKSGE